MGHGYLLQNLDFSCWNLGDTQALWASWWWYWICWWYETTLKTLCDVILGCSKDPLSLFYTFSYIRLSFCCCSVTKSCLSLCTSKHARLPSPSLSPGVCSDSCPLSWWCYLPSHPLLPSSSFAFNPSHWLSFVMLLPVPPGMRTFSLSLHGGHKTQGLPSFSAFWESECSVRHADMMAVAAGRAKFSCSSHGREGSPVLLPRPSGLPWFISFLRCGYWSSFLRASAVFFK